MKEVENKILDDLYSIREGEVEKKYVAKYGEPEEKYEMEKVEEEFVAFMKKHIKQEEIEVLYGEINKYELCLMKRICFWLKPYYKVGFIDGINLKKELQEEKLCNNDNTDSIIYRNINEIIDYVEDRKYKNLKSNDEYNKVTNEIKEIEKKFPKVSAFVYDDEIAEFTKEELKAILNIIDLNNSRCALEANEMFKIGLREGKAL